MLFPASSSQSPLEEETLSPLFQKRPDVHKIVLSIKLLPPPPRESVNFEDCSLICTVFPHFGPFWGGGVKPNFADRNFTDTQTFLTFGGSWYFVYREEKFAYQHRAPQKFVWGKITGTNDFAYFFQEIIRTKGAQKLKKKPPAGTDKKI